MITKTAITVTIVIIISVTSYSADNVQESFTIYLLWLQSTEFSIPNEYYRNNRISIVSIVNRNHGIQIESKIG